MGYVYTSKIYFDFLKRIIPHILSVSMLLEVKNLSILYNTHYI